MSLRDTILGAREELDANTKLTQRDVASTSDASSEEGDKNTGFAKKSISRAKPAREAAAGVRVVDASGREKSTSAGASGVGSHKLSKEERKAARAREQEISDLRFTVSDYTLNQNTDYLKFRRTWWILLGAGFITLIITFVINIVDPAEASDVTTNLGLLSLALIAFSYVAIIAGFIYDWRRIRPLRRAADEVAKSMSVKKLRTQVAAIQAEKLAKKTEKDKKK
ncbi:MAG: hypothetical protein ACOX4F_00590 [Atopobiaceae bacterium]|jgi:hypothetical protein